ncbi:hypothetical protein SERLA73DRAFT_162951 [Serpula lacrymans var. lacrymans S7.3]|uniref:HMG box domain-containing protein n=1 Tax=Serpula lacrymans var. lacrymans (strain S7.3) TaxID=936435 RepID=F8QAQ3_SERL3|nr:hypothetical protein SERLA73DRAFT_162951 [Serpula lacrymans var. lacrymans S7.3]
MYSPPRNGFSHIGRWHCVIYPASDGPKLRELGTWQDSLEPLCFIFAMPCILRSKQKIGGSEQYKPSVSFLTASETHAPITYPLFKSFVGPVYTFFLRVTAFSVQPFNFCVPPLHLFSLFSSCMIVPMNPYNHPEYPAHALLAEHPGSFNSSLRDGRHDEQGSQSESEDGAGYAYPDSHRIELEMEEDPNASLTIQTLNTDGTPKRPMNAFMIFARRRRPQVSAENQSMRTGEISKILSREWVAMDMSEKQFYLDQAKLLKENFNNKYPDYVYRRRPNNTRKKRRTDPGTSKPLEHPVAVDQLADELPQADYGDTSPIDSEDQVMEGVPQNLRYPSLESDIHHGTEYDIQRGVASSHSRSSSYHPPDNSYRQMGASGTRLSYISPPHGRATPDMAVVPPAASARLLDSVNHASQFPSYLHNVQSHHHPSLYSSETNSAHGFWDASATTRGDQGRPPSWVSGSHDRSAVPMDDKSHLYPSVSPHPWNGNVSPAPVGTSSVSGPHTPNYAFPTLNSPFYPNQGHLQGNYNPSSSSPSNSAQPYTTSSQMQSNSLGTRQSSGHGYENRSFSPLPPINPSYSQSNSHDMQSYHHQQIRNPTAPSQMSLPTVQTISQATYRQSHPLHPSPPAGSGADLSSHIGYWSGDKMDNQ